MSRRDGAAVAAKKRAAHRRGLFAETIAALLLRAKGYRVLARRYRAPVGEIDLIARRGPLIVFVEVKARAAPADEIVTLRQRQRIVRAAEAWIARAGMRGALPPEHGARFDVIVVAPWRLPLHLPGAFGGGL